MTPHPLKIAYVYDAGSRYLGEGHDIVKSEDHCSFDSEDMIADVTAALKALGHTVEPFNGIKELVNRLAEDRKLDWDLVFNYAEGWISNGQWAGAGREAQVPALLEAYGT